MQESIFRNFSSVLRSGYIEGDLEKCLTYFISGCTPQSLEVKQNPTQESSPMRDAGFSGVPPTLFMAIG